jgi:hypothetical protein
MSNEPNRVCKEHRDSFSEDCAVCELERARNEMVQTFWLVSKYCEGPYSRIIFETYEEGVKRRQGPPLPEITQEEAMKSRGIRNGRKVVGFAILRTRKADDRPPSVSCSTRRVLSTP